MLYYRAKLEKFAEYLNQDGLVSRITSYDDTGREYKSCFSVNELFFMNILTNFNPLLTKPSAYKYYQDRATIRHLAFGRVTLYLVL